MSSRNDNGDGKKNPMLPVGKEGSSINQPKKGDKRYLRNPLPAEHVEGVGSAKRSTKRKAIRLWVKFALVFLIFGVIVGVAGIAVLASWMSDAPPLGKINIYKSATKIVDINGDFYQELESTQKRVPVSIDQIPELVQSCFVAIEDQRFYNHFGIDVRGTFKAVTNVLATGETDGPGGSTITQQLIKLTHLTSEKRIARKAQEWKLAYLLEKQYSKRQILEAYLNEVNMKHAWGIESASNLFFNKSVGELNLSQAAILTSIVNLPTVYDPYAYETDEDGNRVISRVVNDNGIVRVNLNPKNRDRAILVLAKMLELGNITDREYEIAKAELENNEVDLQLPTSLEIYSYFTDACFNAVIEDMISSGWISRELAVSTLLSGGYTIHSTIDPVIQATLDKEVENDSNFPAQTSAARTASSILSDRSGEEIDLIPQIGGAIIQNETGYIVAITGGRGKKTGNLQLNRGVTKFQTGSTTKPITVYAPGFDTGALTLATTFDNVRMNFNGFNPTNSPGVYNGMTTCRAGIRESINIVAVHALYKVGFETSVEYGRKFGFDIDPKDESAPGALALGGFTYGQTPLALASAFSTFPNAGNRVKPVFYTSVTSPSGQELCKPDSINARTVSVISPEAAFITTDALKQVVRGGTTTISVPGQQIGGKTGTTNESQNVLFAGFTKEYTGAFWFGYDYLKVGNTKLFINTTSGQTRSPAFFWERVFRGFYEAKGLPNANLPSKPDGVITATVDSVSGKAPTELSYRDPRGSQVISEYFIRNTTPSQKDDLHVLASVCSVTGMLPSSYCPAVGRVCIDKDPSKLYAWGCKPANPGYVSSWEAGVIKPTSVCTLHAGGFWNPPDVIIDLPDDRYNNRPNYPIVTPPTMSPPADGGQNADEIFYVND
ncbi:MAG: transglycosylase domain-containing protein [Eubacteriaceae bacterium]|nr:transglycosylase domain-containing protein [Eubacteriaceae bacterium]